MSSRGHLRPTSLSGTAWPAYLLGNAQHTAPFIRSTKRPVAFNGPFIASSLSIPFTVYGPHRSCPYQGRHDGGCKINVPTEFILTWNRPVKVID